MVVLVTMSTGVPSFRIELIITLQLSRISKPAVHLCPRYEYLYFQQDDDQIGVRGIHGRGIHSVTHHLRYSYYSVLLH